MLTAVQYEDVARRAEPGQRAGHRPRAIRTGGASSTATSRRSPRPAAPLAKLAATIVGRGARPARRGAARLASPPPRATYRLQFHKDFTFDDARRDRALSRAARDQPRLRLADPEGAARLDPRLRHRRPRRDQPGARRRGRLRPPLRRAAASTGSGCSSTSCRTTWASAAPTIAWWLSVLEWGDALAPRPRLRHRLGAARRRTASSSCPSSATATARRSKAATLKLNFDAAEGHLQRLALRARLPDLARSHYPLDPRPGARRARRVGAAMRRVLAVSERLRAMGEETEPRAPPRLPGRGRGAEAAGSPRRSRPRPALAERDRAGASPSSTASTGCPTASAAAPASGDCNPTASPIGGSRRATSTTAASSTSTRSPACGSRSPRSSRRSHETDLPPRPRGPHRGPAHRPYRRARRSARATLAPLQAAVGPGFYVRGREDPRARREAAALAGRRHDRLRRAEPARRHPRRPREHAERIDALLSLGHGHRRAPTATSSARPRPRSWRSASPANSRCWSPDLKRGRRCRPAHARLHGQRPAPRALIEIIARFPDLPHLPAGDWTRARRGRGRRV